MAGRVSEVCKSLPERQAPTLAAPASAIRSHSMRLLGPFFEAVVSKVCQTKGAGTLVSLHKTFLPRGRSSRKTPVPHPYPECNLQLFSSTCCCLIIFLPFHLKKKFLQSLKSSLLIPRKKREKQNLKCPRRRWPLHHVLWVWVLNSHRYILRFKQAFSTICLMICGFRVNSSFFF